MENIDCNEMMISAYCDCAKKIAIGLYEDGWMAEDIFEHLKASVDLLKIRLEADLRKEKGKRKTSKKKGGKK